MHLDIFLLHKSVRVCVELYHLFRASVAALLVKKNPPERWETWVLPLGWEDPLEKGMATHSSVLAWSVLVHGVTKS